MSTKLRFDNFTRKFGDKISTARAKGKSMLENIIGGAITKLTNIFDGGFTGMSAEGLQELKSQLTNYCSEIENKINDFDQTGDITSALKGDVQGAAYEFIAAIKELLKAYVSTMKQGIEEADEAYENFLAAGKSISSVVTDDASEIRSNASNIRLD